VVYLGKPDHGIHGTAQNKMETNPKTLNSTEKEGRELPNLIPPAST
jgi:hypothetical protein